MEKNRGEIQTNILKLTFLVCLLEISCVVCIYPTYIVEDVCKLGNETIIYDTSLTGIVGILKATSRPPYAPNKECTISIVPPPGHDIVLSIQKIDLRQKGFSCLDYIKIYHSDRLSRYPIQSIMLCRFKFDLQGKISFYSHGTMEIEYHVAKEGYRGFNFEEGFSLTYTVVTDDVKECCKDDMFMCNNGLCIPNYLNCDGQNNCGDRSEEGHILCDTVDVTVFQIVDMGYFIVFSFLVFSVIVTCLITRRRRLAASNQESAANGFVPYPMDPKVGQAEFASYGYPPPPPPYSQ